MCEKRIGNLALGMFGLAFLTGCGHTSTREVSYRAEVSYSTEEEDALRYAARANAENARTGYALAYGVRRSSEENFVEGDARIPMAAIGRDGIPLLREVDPGGKEVFFFFRMTRNGPEKRGEYRGEVFYVESRTALRNAREGSRTADEIERRAIHTEEARRREEDRQTDRVLRTADRIGDFVLRFVH